MTQDQSIPLSTQVSTTDLEGTPSTTSETLTTPSVPPVDPVASAPDPDQNPGTTREQDAATEAPNPSADAGQLLHPQMDTKEGVGVDGEAIVWEARYSMKNFFGRLIGLGLLVLGWIALAIYTWGSRDAAGGMAIFTTLLGVVVGVIALMLALRIIRARYSHYYRLTTRRMFVSTGLFNRRRDMTELLKVEDVYTRQTLIQRWLGVGTVVVVSSDQKFPIVQMPGVDDPKGVMDTVWHFARAERDQKSVRIDTL